MENSERCAWHDPETILARLKSVLPYSDHELLLRFGEPGSPEFMEKAERTLTGYGKWGPLED